MVVVLPRCAESGVGDVWKVMWAARRKWCGRWWKVMWVVGGGVEKRSQKRSQGLFQKRSTVAKRFETVVFLGNRFVQSVTQTTLGLVWPRYDTRVWEPGRVIMRSPPTPHDQNALSHCACTPVANSAVADQPLPSKQHQSDSKY